MPDSSAGNFVNIVFLFDANYLAPALVSVASLFDIPEMIGFSVTLVYVSSNSEKDTEAANILRIFQSNIQSKDQQINLHVIVLQGNQFSDYVQRYHFSNAILYKAALPKIFSSYQHILFFDCGMIFGLQLPVFIERLRQSIQRSEISVVGAFCVSPFVSGALNLALQQYSHNILYPSAAVLYFDVQRYNQLAIYERYLAAYSVHRQQLHYAEQDLLCLVLQAGELSAFEDREFKYHIDMASPESWSDIDRYERIYMDRNYLYLKHIGSFKPWKKWVLHPAKAIYLRELQRLEKRYEVAGYSALQDSELFPENTAYLAHQLILLEAHMKNTTKLDG